MTHVSRLEFIWTTLPFVYFYYALGVRSIYTLYVIDMQLKVRCVVKAFGRQWFWQYEVVENIAETFCLYQLVDLTALEEQALLQYGWPKDDLVMMERSSAPKIFDSYLVISNEALVEGSERRNLQVDTPLALLSGFPVRFLTTGMDVLHSFALPSFGLKIDSVPGRLNACDIALQRQGVFYGQCSELCGQGHAYMPIAVYVSDLV